MKRRIALKPFQIEAVEELKRDVLHKWRRETRQNVKFQSPTGSGKTVMMAQFVRDLVKSPELAGSDFAFLWASIGGSKDGDLASQSKGKFDDFYGGASEVSVTGLDSLSRNKVLDQHEILFFNWSKIKVRNKDGRKLRRQNEQEITWDGMIKRTQARERAIILIIDEAHRESGTLLAEEEIKLIQPKIVVHVTATHRGDEEDIDVHIPHKEVVDSGLIKESIESQTKEEFAGKRIKDLDRHVLKLALKKRKNLAQSYQDIGSDIQPLLMIQLPNDERASQEETKKDLVLRWLRDEGVEDAKVAVWLDGDQVNLENITIHNNEVEVLLFKQAPATGWDCPRAQVLLMYRETRDPIFQVQVLGRVLRMPEGKHYRRSTLNKSYLYTTYTKNEIIDSYDNFQGENQAAIYHSYMKSGVEQISLESFVSQRTRYNDLGKTFQHSFIETANDLLGSKKGAGLNLQFDDKVDVSLIIDQNITDYDGFIESIRESDSFGQKMSHNDVEKLYRKLCIEILRKQEDGAKFGNIARSYGKLKSAINVWFERYVKIKDKKKYYPCIVNDLSRGANSVLLPIINEALKSYKVVREKEEEEKEKRRRDTKEVFVPPNGVSYTSIYDEMKDSKKCALDPCYINKKNKNEREFIDFLEGNELVVHWYKNGDSGSEYFSVMREDGRLFFPDWFVWAKNGIWVVDTKGGFTAEGEETKMRARALEEWLKKHKKFKGGLVKSESGIWKIAQNSKLGEWVNLRFE